MAYEYLNRKERNMFNKDAKIFNSLNGHRYYCKCGHSVVITPRQERALCDWCHHWIYKDEIEQEKHDSITREKEKELQRYKFRKELSKRL